MTDWDEEVERERLPRVRTTEDVEDTSDIETTPVIEGTENIDTADVTDVEREAGRGESSNLGPGLPPEDEEVNPVGSYEEWNQSGQGLDAAGRGMTGDAGAEGLTGTGFEDDDDLNRERQR